MNSDLISYYNARAREYEKVYLNPDEQDDLQRAARIFEGLFAGKAVLELACGTGYWTERIATVASSVYATDINESVIEIAREKGFGDNVAFEVADMFTFSPESEYDAVFCGFIWSHVLLQELDKFLFKAKSFLKPGGMIVFIDGNPVKGTSHDLKHLTKTDDHGNTFQTRTLEDGSIHLVLKNFPSEDFLRQRLSKVAADISVTKLEYYWIAIAGGNEN